MIRRNIIEKREYNMILLKYLSSIAPPNSKTEKKYFAINVIIIGNLATANNM